MPLTVPAHQLLVLPLLRGRLPLPGVALLVGTVLPDLAFVVGGYGLNAHAHLGYGPLFMVPLGLLLYAWFESLFLPALGRALPADGSWPLARLCITRGLARSWRAWLGVIAALLVGAYSHVIFDGFTHAKAWPARELYSRAVAFSLQITFSVLGSVIVLLWARHRLRAAPACAEAPDWRRARRLVALAILAGAVVGLAIGLAILGWPETRRQLVFLILSPGGLGAFAGTTVAAARLQGSQSNRSDDTAR